jgi:hypothetical protein
MSKFVDNFGLPGTFNSEGWLDMGDSAAIYFNVEALAPSTFKVNENFYFNVNPVRHPDYSKWWGQPDRCSRDQMIPMLCWAALQKKKHSEFINKLFLAHKKHKFLYAWNTKKNGEMDVPDKKPDLTTFEVWGLWLRIYQPKWAKWVLWICDLETLLGSISWKFRKDRVTRNHMLVSLTQNKVMPTFISKISYKLNNFQELNNRWNAHCKAVGEYPTAPLFERELYG